MAKCIKDCFAELYLKERGISDVEWCSTSFLNDGRIEIKYRRKDGPATQNYVSIIYALDLLANHVTNNTKS